jgi:hypothetical protein
LFGVGPACFLGTGLLVLLLRKVEKVLEMQTYYLTGGLVLDSFPSFVD